MATLHSTDQLHSAIRAAQGAVRACREYEAAWRASGCLPEDGSRKYLTDLSGAAFSLEYAANQLQEAIDPELKAEVGELASEPEGRTV